MCQLLACCRTAGHFFEDARAGGLCAEHHESSLPARRRLHAVTKQHRLQLEPELLCMSWPASCVLLEHPETAFKMQLLHVPHRQSQQAMPAWPLLPWRLQLVPEQQQQLAGGPCGGLAAGCGPSLWRACPWLFTGAGLAPPCCRHKHNHLAVCAAPGDCCRALPARAHPSLPAW